jgi:hypothetical protein
MTMYHLFDSAHIYTKYIGIHTYNYIVTLIVVQSDSPASTPMTTAQASTNVSLTAARDSAAVSDVVLLHVVVVCISGVMGK